MSAVLVKINAIIRALPKAEKLVAEHIISHPAQAPFYSVSQLASATRVSIASVSRLSKKLGYESFTDLKIALAQGTETGIDTIYQDIATEDSDEEIVQKVFAGNVKSLEDTYKILDTGDLIKAARKISRAKRLVFLGIGSSGNIARDAAIRFCHLGLHVDACNDSYQIVTQMLNLTARDMVVGISHSGRSRATVQGLELARANGAGTIGISNYARSPLSGVCELFFCTSFPESKVRVAALSSRLSQMCLIDTLHVLVAGHLKKLDNTERFNRVTEEILRFPEKK